MIDWLIQRAGDDPRVAAGLPPEGLLSAPETAVFDGLHSDKRRRDWLLGRWTAKKLYQASLKKVGAVDPPCDEIAILAAKDGAPEIWLAGREHLRRVNRNISISHSRGVSLCAVSTSLSQQLGADIEAIAPRPGRFVEDYFCDEEKEIVRRTPLEGRDCLVTAIWSGKESALKAVRQGLHVDTRAVCCVLQTPFKATTDWCSFSVRWPEQEDGGRYPRLNGWWRTWQDFVLTLVIGE